MGKLEPLFAQIKASNLKSLDGARVYVHRDFMPRNLMVDHNGDLGVLDFQDAVYGPITYDIASLMRDAFLSWEEEFVLDITVRYWQKARKAGLPVGDDFGEFYRARRVDGPAAPPEGARHFCAPDAARRQAEIPGRHAALHQVRPRHLRRYRQLGPLMVLLDEIEGNETRVGYTF